MTKQEIIEIAKEIGIFKGYRIDYPEDWYGGFNQKELYEKITNYNPSIKKHFNFINNIVRNIFPEYYFLEWKFKNTSKGFWDEHENSVLYLRWLEKELDWSKPEDWYNLNQKLLIDNYGRYFNTKYIISEIPSVLYPKYVFDYIKFNKIRNGYWDDFEVLKKFLLPKCEAVGRMLTDDEISNIKGLKEACGKHGGIIKVAEKIGFNVALRYKTLSGNIVASSYEVIVDNFLYLNDIKFEHENKICNEKKYRYDFKVNDYFIEIWGLFNKVYVEKRNKKEQLYSLKNFKLISLEYYMFYQKIYHINEDLKQVCKKYNIKTDNFYNEDLNKLKFFESYDKENVIMELYNEYLRLNLKIFPTKYWWNKNGFSRQINFLINNKIDISEITKRFNITETTAFKSRNYWKDYTNIENELLPICDDIGQFPTKQYLITNNKSSLSNAIIVYHGGLEKIAIKLGYKLTHKVRNYWVDWDNLKKEILLLYKQNNCFPSYSFLIKTKNNPILSSARKYHGGWVKVRKIFEENNYYKNEI